MEHNRPYYSYHLALRSLHKLIQHIKTLTAQAPFLKDMLHVIGERVKEYGTCMVQGSLRFPSYQFEIETTIHYVKEQFPSLDPPTPEEVAAAHAPPRILSYPFVCRMTCREAETYLTDIFEPDAPPLLYVKKLQHFFIVVSDWLLHQHKASLL
jgi:hypothetical protein